MKDMGGSKDKKLRNRKFSPNITGEFNSGPLENREFKQSKFYFETAFFTSGCLNSGSVLFNRFLPGYQLLDLPIWVAINLAGGRNCGERAGY